MHKFFFLSCKYFEKIKPEHTSHFVVIYINVFIFINKHVLNPRLRL